MPKRAQSGPEGSDTNRDSDFRKTHKGPAGFVDGEDWEEPLSDAEAEAAVERVRGTASLPLSPERRAELLAELISVPVPDLRAESGRLDAIRIAVALGISVRQLAQALPVKPQALSQTPDSPRAQLALHPFARTIEALRVVLPESERKAWLQTPHVRWQDRSPLQVMLAGDAEAVACALGLLRDGGVGQ